MITLSRRNFILLVMVVPLMSMHQPHGKVNTVGGQVSTFKLGKTLIHEHVLVDFIGADKVNESRWDKLEVVERMAPYFVEARMQGVKTIVECTPAFLGRDARLLKMLSERTGIQIITNTGYYGAVNNKYLPPWAFTETDIQLSQRWIDDFEFGIDGSNIRPGFIKISVDAHESGLTDLHKKIVRAAALTHLKTGLTIYSHTGIAKAAFEQLDILKSMNVSPSAFVWVHAQAEQDKSTYIKAAKMGAWVSLDGISDNNIDEYISSLVMLKKENLLNRTLISHDAGYYRPEENDGGKIKGYTAIFQHLIPALLKNGFTRKDINILLEDNPARALMLGVKKL